MKRYFLYFFCILFAACASPYKPVNPPEISYRDTKDGGAIGFSYQYDVLYRVGNKKYAKIVTAGTANRNLEAELQTYSLDKPLENGQTMYALIGFQSFDYGSLDVRLKN